MQEHTNKNRQPLPNYQPGDKVWLSTRNIKTQRPLKKLDDKNILATVVSRIGRDSYELQLPEGMERLHPVFHISLLRLDPEDPLPRQHNKPQEPIRIKDDQGIKHNKWEVERIIDS